MEGGQASPEEALEERAGRQIITQGTQRDVGKERKKQVCGIRGGSSGERVGVQQGGQGEESSRRASRGALTLL